MGPGELGLGGLRLYRMRPGDADLGGVRPGEMDLGDRGPGGVRPGEMDLVGLRPGDMRPGEVGLAGIRRGRSRVVVRGGRGRRQLGGRGDRCGGLGERIPGGTPVRIVEALLHDLADLVPRRYQLEHAAVDLPVSELFRLVSVMAQVGDVQPVAEVVEHDAAAAPERAHRPGLPQRLHVLDPQLLAPVAGGGLEAQLLWGRAGGEQHHILVGGADARLVRHTAVGRHQPVSHAQIAPTGRSHTCPSNRAMNSVPPELIR